MSWYFESIMSKAKMTSLKESFPYLCSSKYTYTIRDMCSGESKTVEYDDLDGYDFYGSYVTDDGYRIAIILTQMQKASYGVVTQVAHGIPDNFDAIDPRDLGDYADYTQKILCVSFTPWDLTFLSGDWIQLDSPCINGGDLLYSIVKMAKDRVDLSRYEGVAVRDVCGQWHTLYYDKEKLVRFLGKAFVLDRG